MQKISVCLIFVILTVFITMGVYAADEEKNIRGKHLEAEISCADCHSTDTPVKQAPQSACKSCHEGMETNPDIVMTDDMGKQHTVSPHNSHAGQLRCTLCHVIHKPSVLYCNEGCHHTFVINVP